MIILAKVFINNNVERCILPYVYKLDCIRNNSMGLLATVYWDFFFYFRKHKKNKQNLQNFFSNLTCPVTVLLRALKILRFYPTWKLTSKSVTTSWNLTEDMGPLGQK